MVNKRVVAGVILCVGGAALTGFSRTFTFLSEGRRDFVAGVGVGLVMVGILIATKAWRQNRR